MSTAQILFLAECYSVYSFMTSLKFSEKYVCFSWVALYDLEIIGKCLSNMHALEFMCSECHLLYCCPVTLVSWNVSQLKKLSVSVIHLGLLGF